MDLKEIIPNNQIEVFGHDKTMHNFINLYNNKKLPNKILLSGPKGIGKSTLAYHLVNFIFSKNEDFKYSDINLKINEKNKSFNLVKNNTHPNFFLIDLLADKKLIEIAQIREMISYSNKSSFNNKERIILIDNVESLNRNSLNALLKIVEEPNDKMIFILIFDNNKKILDTLKSRCIKFNISLSFEKSLVITNKILKLNIVDCIQKNFINYYFTPGDYISLINFSNQEKINLLEINLKKFLINMINGNYYRTNEYVKKNIFKFIELYFLNLININKSKLLVSNKYSDFIKKISDVNKFNLDKEALFIELKTELLNG